MKTKKIVMLVIVGMFVGGCSVMREKTAEELLENKKMEGEIYLTILNDSIHLAAFIDKMLAEENISTVMSDKGSILKKVCMSKMMDSIMNTDRELMGFMADKMVKRMEADTSACSMMCSKVMENERLKQYVAEHACIQMNEHTNKK